MTEISKLDPDATPQVHPLVNFLSRLWLIPKREYLRRFRFGRTVNESVLGLELTVLPDVFNPVIFRTGRYFARVLATSEFGHGTGRRVLDLGCGTGILGLVMAKNGFTVDAVDINPEAVRCTTANAIRNGLADRVEVHAGDLFAPVAERKYDIITFSPPSFRGEPRSQFELCWRAVDVFERFAAALPGALRPGGVALVLQTSHGDEPGLLRALLSTQLHVDLFARRHFGVEIFSIYRLRHRL